MSFRLMTEVLDCENLGPTEKLVMVCLARHVNEQTGKCFPSVERLMRCSGLGERAVQTNIKELTKRGFIVIVKGGGRGRANEYVLSVKGASKTPFDKPRISNTVLESVNPASNALNPAADAPQYRMNIEEQRNSNIKARKPSSDAECIEILSSWVSRESADGFVKYRRASKHKAMTPRAANSLAGKLKELFNLGMDTDAALLKAEERGWATIEVEWIMRDQKNVQRNYNSQQSTKGQLGSDPALENIARIVGLSSS